MKWWKVLQFLTRDQIEDQPNITMSHHIVSLPELDGSFILRCSCGWITHATDHRASLNAARNHKEEE